MPTISEFFGILIRMYYDDQEVLCYLHGWLFEKMYKFYKEEGNG